MSNNLYTKISELENTKPYLGEILSEDQKKIMNSMLMILEKELANNRNRLSHKSKILPGNEEIKRQIDSISYSTINIRHLKVKLGLEISSEIKKEK